jgi:hypothetical protein
MKRITQLRPLLETAQELTEPTESNPEYIRGQANLICDFTGIHSDQNELVMLCISHGISVSAAIQEIIDREKEFS